MLIGTVSANGQELIKGIVMDSATFEPLPYVSIRIKNRNQGTTSDTKGNFALIANEIDTLVFSFIGYHDVTYPLKDWEPSIIRMSEKRTMLNSVIIKGTAINPYRGLFDEQNAILQNRKVPFLKPKYKKEKIRLGWLIEDNLRAHTYVDLLVSNSEKKTQLMTLHQLSEGEYYQILTQFNEQNVDVMYFLTKPELVTLLNNFFARAARQRK